MFDNINVHKILKYVDVGIWIIKFDTNTGKHEFYVDDTLRKLMGIEKNHDMKPEEIYEYWYKRIELKDLEKINRVFKNMIRMFYKQDYKYTIDEVDYIWNSPKQGRRNIRCGGKIIEYKNGVYKMCGYHQDYSNILISRDRLKESTVNDLEKLKNITYLKEYYRKMAYIDELTGILNRRGFWDKIYKIMQTKMRRRNDRLWISIMDVDFFKKINDTYGHLSGDKVLKFIGDFLLEFNKRYKNAYVFRYGGEEFVILFYQMSIDDIKDKMSEIRYELSNRKIKIDKDIFIDITCSIGVGIIKNNKTMSIEDNINNGIKQADRALYVAKETGRDRVCFSEEIEEVEYDKY